MWLLGVIVLVAGGFAPALWLGSRGTPVDRLVGLELAGAVTAADPTGLSSPLGRWVILAGLVAALVVLIVQWRRRR